LLIDSHCHLQALAEDDRGRALDAARAAGVTGFLVPATKPEDWDEVLAIAHAHSDVWCTLGVHPHDASTWSAEVGGRLRRLLADPRVVGVGECGLDFHYDFAPRAAQAAALREQWTLAVELDLPVVVHNRESDEAMLDVVRQPAFGGLRGDFHSFAGSPEMARELTARGFYFGFSGMVTFKSADNIRALLAATPNERLLLETDTPFLAPVPHRGRPNRPAHVALVAARVAAERALSAAELGRLTSDNFFRLFRRAASA
jgi:TatD DNase family protein